MFGSKLFTPASICDRHTGVLGCLEGSFKDSGASTEKTVAARLLAQLISDMLFSRLRFLSFVSFFFKQTDNEPVSHCS